MALQTSGQISLNDVNVELGNSGTAQIDMNDAAVRGLFDIASGEIEMADGYGKSDSSPIAVNHTQTTISNGNWTSGGTQGFGYGEYTINLGPAHAGRRILICIGAKNTKTQGVSATGTGVLYDVTVGGVAAPSIAPFTEAQAIGNDAFVNMYLSGVVATGTSATVRFNLYADDNSRQVTWEGVLAVYALSNASATIEDWSLGYDNNPTNDTTWQQTASLDVIEGGAVVALGQYKSSDPTQTVTTFPTGFDSAAADYRANEDNRTFMVGDHDLVAADETGRAYAVNHTNASAQNAEGNVLFVSFTPA